MKSQEMRKIQTKLMKGLLDLVVLQFLNRHLASEGSVGMLDPDDSKVGAPCAVPDGQVVAAPEAHFNI